MFSVSISSPVDHRTSPSRSPSFRSCRKNQMIRQWAKESHAAMHAAMCLAFPPVLQLLPSQVSLSEVKRPNSLRLACFDSDRFCQSLPIMSGVNAYDWKIMKDHHTSTYWYFLNFWLEWSVGLIGGCQMMPGTPTIGHWDPSRIPCQTHLVDYNELMHRHNDPLWYVQRITITPCKKKDRQIFRM